jgi:hypothetical protein
MCHDFHTSNVHQLKIQKQYKYFDNQEYMTPIQYIIKKILSFFRTKISLKTKLAVGLMTEALELQLKCCIPFMLNLR